MRPGAVLFWGLMLAMLFNLLMQARSRRRERRMEIILREVHAVLVVWAETWPDEGVRQKLLQVLTR